MSLRVLTEEDLPLVRAWRNAPEVRQSMYSKHEIGEDEHRAWFRRMVQDPQARWYLHEDEAGQADGVVYFTHYQPSNGNAFWGFYAAPGAKPGAGGKMAFEALELAFSALGLHKLNAEVLGSNGKSIHFHKKCGFSQEGLFRDFHFDGEHYVDVVRFGILASEWAVRREELRARLASLAAAAPAQGVARMDKKKYIVASAKEWHRAAFETLQSDIDADWVWVATPEALSAAVAAGAPRYIFFLHWNWHVPAEIWSRHECVCFHMTDLPYGRGGSPLQNLIVAGHQETRLTALRMVEEMDAGPVYTKRPLALQGRAEDIYRAAGRLSLEIIRWMIPNAPEPVPQAGEAVNFKRRRPFQSVLPEHGEIEALYDHVRMLDAETYPLAFIEYGEFRLEFSHAELEGEVLGARVSLRKIGAPGAES